MGELIRGPEVAQNKSMRLLIGTLAFALGSVVVAQVAGPQSVATTKDIMLHMTIPASNAVFDAGSKEKMTDADWAEARKQALILAESGNLLMTPGRMASGQAKGGATKGKATKGVAANPAAWNTAARALVDAGKLAVTAIDKKDMDLLAGDVGEKVLNSCSGCHDRYMIK
jgi:cytochrome c556